MKVSNATTHRLPKGGTELPPDLAALFAAAPQAPAEDLASLEKAAQALDRDPAFLAEQTKALVLEDILRAMEDQNLTLAILAKRMGKSRQYVHRVLDEDSRVNFTLETLAEFAAALGLKLFTRLVANCDHMLVFRRITVSEEVTATGGFPEAGQGESVIRDEEFEPRDQFEARHAWEEYEKTEDDRTILRA